MFSSSQAAVTIFGMALATYLTRTAGLFLVNRIRVTNRVEAFLQAVPGTILVSIVAPIVLSSGIAESIASVATVLTSWRTKNLALSMLVGVATVWLLRHFVT